MKQPKSRGRNGALRQELEQSKRKRWNTWTDAARPGRVGERAQRFEKERNEAGNWQTVCCCEKSCRSWTI